MCWTIFLDCPGIQAHARSLVFKKRKRLPKREALCAILRDQADQWLEFVQRCYTIDAALGMRGLIDERIR